MEDAEDVKEYGCHEISDGFWATGDCHQKHPTLTCIKHLQVVVVVGRQP